MATAAELAILLKLHDEMSADLKKAEANVKSFGSTIDRVGRIATGVLVAAGIRAGLREVVGFFQSATAAAEEHARVEAQVNAVIKSTGGAAGVTSEQVFKLADAYQNVTRFSDEQVASAEALLLTFTRIGKDIFPQVTETVLDMATALGEDTSSAAIQLGKALQDPILGVTALRRVGVAFTADQQKQIKTLVESGHGMEAQKLILAELKTEFGGSATALTDWEKTMRRVNVAIDEGKEKLGAIIQGGLMLLANWLDEHADDIENFVGRFAPAFDGALEFVEARIGGVISAIETLLDTINSLSDLVSDIAHGRWQDAWEDMLRVVTNFGKTLLNTLVAVFGALPNLVIDAVNEAIDAVNKVKIPERIGASIGLGPLGSIGGSVPIPGGGGNLNIPNVPRIPTKPFDITGAIQTMEKLGEAANKASPPVRKVVDDFGEAPEKVKKLSDALEKWQEAMGKVFQDFINMTGIANATSALFGRPTREQADLQLFQAQQNLTKARFGDKAVHFGPGEGPGTLAKTERQLKTLDAEHDLLQKRITAANALLITEGQLNTEAEKLRDLMEKQSTLIRDKLNPGINDLYPEIRTAYDGFTNLNSILNGPKSVVAALTNFARQLSEFKLPELKNPDTGSVVPFSNAFQGP
jgi:hypothetical protein